MSDESQIHYGRLQLIVWSDKKLLCDTSSRWRKSMFRQKGKFYLYMSNIYRANEFHHPKQIKVSNVKIDHEAKLPSFMLIVQQLRNE